jgi:S-adenosylmethionine/arginine decarboxylase-like enzyme
VEKPEMTISSEPFGIHIMIEGFGAPRQLLSNRAYLYTMLEDLPEVIGMGAAAEPQLIESGAFSQINPGRLSGFVMNAECHLGFHAVPARGYVSVDFHARRTIADRQGVIDLLASSFALKQADVCVQECGLRQPAQYLQAAGQMRASPFFHSSRIPASAVH